MKELKCLKCSSDLSKLKNKLRCTKCGSEWKIDKGIPQFTENAAYWGEITKNEMIFVNKQINSGKYWKDVLKNITDNNPRDQFPEPYSFTTDLSRANWRYLLSLKKNSKVLDIGCGLGTISEIMSRHYKQVVAIEPVTERINFCKKRFEQEGIKNIKLVKANVLDLPFKENSFDLIIMNGVLEWVAISSKNNPKKVQQKVLKNILKLLKPNGCLYIGIENRLSYRHFLGHMDPHVNLIFISLLPRYIAHIYSRIFTGKKYRTYIYSYRGYKKLLKKSGFNKIDVYNVLPNYNVPEYIIPIKNKYIYDYILEQFVDSSHSIFNKISLTIGRLLTKLGFVQYFFDSFIIFAKK